jgi:hypothetical protein
MMILLRRLFFTPPGPTRRVFSTRGRVKSTDDDDDDDDDDSVVAIIFQASEEERERERERELKRFFSLFFLITPNLIMFTFY